MTFFTESEGEPIFDGAHAGIIVNVIAIRIGVNSAVPKNRAEFLIDLLCGQRCSLRRKVMNAESKGEKVPKTVIMVTIS
jgi:hypothetical protein